MGLAYISLAYCTCVPQYRLRIYMGTLNLNPVSVKNPVNTAAVIQFICIGPWSPGWAFRSKTGVGLLCKQTYACCGIADFLRFREPPSYRDRGTLSPHTLFTGFLITSRMCYLIEDIYYFA